MLLLDRSEDALKLRRSPFLREHKSEEDSQSAAGISQGLSRTSYRIAVAETLKRCAFKCISQNLI